MKALIIYDSVFGNTEKIANAIGEAMLPGAEVEIKRIGSVVPEQLNGLDLLVVGSPTRGFRPTEPISQFLRNIPRGSLKGVKIAAFDTRVSVEDVNNAILSFLVKIFGYAAQPINKGLVNKGGFQMAEPQGYIVKESEGPLQEGELERAALWAGSLVKA
ncbi:MAG: nitric oxide synthase [Anaerolineae bacterium]|nr:nitric oxide synthase [Anaerolineae bacterium]